MSVRFTDSQRNVCPWQRKTVVQMGINIDQKILFMKCRYTKQLMLQKHTLKPFLSNREISDVLDCGYLKQSQSAAKTSKVNRVEQKQKVNLQRADTQNNYFYTI